MLGEQKEKKNLRMDKFLLDILLSAYYSEIIMKALLALSALTFQAYSWTQSEYDPPILQLLTVRIQIKGKRFCSHGIKISN